MELGIAAFLADVSIESKIAWENLPKNVIFSPFIIPPYFEQAFCWGPNLTSYIPLASFSINPFMLSISEG